MNIRQFLSYRENCLACGSIMNTTFQTKNRKILRFNNDCMTIECDLDNKLYSTAKKQKMHKIIYSLGMINNHFHIDFATRDNIIYDKHVPLNVIKRYRDYDNNVKSYKFYRYCNICNNHSYTSNKLIFNYKSSTFNDIKVATESLFVYKNVGIDKNKHYHIINDYDSSTTDLYLCNMSDSHHREYIKNPNKYLDILTCSISLLKLSSKEELMVRIDKLILFS